MPMCDIFLPKGCFSDSVEEELVSTISKRIVAHEIRRWSEIIGAESVVMQEAAEQIAWMFVHRTDEVYVASKKSTEPRYKFIITIPDGTIDEKFAPGISKDIFMALRKAENGAHPLLSTRVWIIIREVKDGLWCAGDRPMPRASMIDFLKYEMEHAPKE